MNQDKTKTLINKAGDSLSGKPANDLTESEAWSIINDWRLCHAYPINTFQATLKKKLLRKSYGSNSIVAQRLKRSTTIIEKLRDLHGMRLTRMQDIAGVRAILPLIQDVFDLTHEYSDNTDFGHILKLPIKDYISNPKEDGYRSIHLVYSYRNKHKPEFDDLKVELQIRTKLQHSWAMAVETMQRFLKKSIKIRTDESGDKAWKGFFEIVSSAFAIIECTPVLQKHANLTEQEIFNAVARSATGLKVLEKMKAFPVAMKSMEENKKSFYNLITLDTKEKVVYVSSFGRNEFPLAYNAYKSEEQRNLLEPHKDTVLVSTTRGSLERAYPSFFDESKDFITNLETILKRAKI